LQNETMKQIDSFFDPKSVAVVGASRKTFKAGAVIFRNFYINRNRGLFKGELYPVNPSEEEILGLKSYPTLRDIPREVEAAVIVIPAAAVPQAMEDAAAKGVKAVTIISAGFGEIGNHELERRVKEIALNAGIRVLGPNCLGVYDARTGVDMLFLPETKVLLSGEEVVATPRPMPGNISLISQSGAFGAAALDYMAGNEFGVDKFASFGNKMDISEPEMLEYFSHEKETKVILLYAESIEKGREFLEVARRVSHEKPIVALKSGRTASGARAAVSHTGALAGSDKIYDAAFRQAGVIRAKSMESFFDMAKALALQPPAAGRRVVVLTDGGGAGVMTVDECESLGIEITNLPEDLVTKFEEMKRDGTLPSFATNVNPVDLTGSVTSEMFEKSVRVLLDHPQVHGVILIGLHHAPAVREDFVDRVYSVWKISRKPLVFCDIGETEMARELRRRFEKLGVPAYPSPERAAAGMAGLVEYGVFLCHEGRLEAYLEKRWPRPSGGGRGPSPLPGGGGRRRRVPRPSAGRS